MHETALVIVARYPEAGKTKTRLARTLGNEETLQLYRAFLTDLAQRFAGMPDMALHWAYTPADVNYADFVARLAPFHAHATTCFPQQGHEFGARLHHAFQWTRAQDFEYTILIGSDSPQISREIIENARKALDEVDVVLGPADDGGYYLLAMRKPYDVFTGVPMSTSVVLEMTIELARSQGLSVRLLDPLFDVDEFSDLLRLAALLRTDDTLAPATAALLTKLKASLQRDDYLSPGEGGLYTLCQ
jgi:uncharacterized protein